jgi:hypothetical protein
MAQQIAERIRVLYPSGRLAYHATTTQARQLIRAGLGRAIGQRRTIVAIELCDGPSRIPTGQKYSHNHDTPDNPEKCWTLKHIDTEDRICFVMSLFPPETFTRKREQVAATK